MINQFQISTFNFATTKFQNPTNSKITQYVLKWSSKVEMASNAIKSFSSIPGPYSYPLIGTLGSYFLTKKYHFDRLHWNGKKKFEEFGPIVREEIVPGAVYKQ
jgi:hypothetical protein